MFNPKRQLLIEHGFEKISMSPRYYLGRPLIYWIPCFQFNEDYIGKTESALHRRIRSHKKKFWGPSILHSEIWIKLLQSNMEICKLENMYIDIFEPSLNCRNSETREYKEIEIMETPKFRYAA